MKQSNSQVKKLLTKLATGFEYQEVAEEFVPEKETGGFVLVKRKITSHYVMPDINAIKMLLNLTNVDQTDFQTMSDEELLNLKKQLIADLAKGEKNET